MDRQTVPYTVSSHWRLWMIVTLLAGLVLLRWAVSVGQASTTIVVNSTLDRVSNDGLCTLREAIIAANKDVASGRLRGECAAGRGADTIMLTAGNTYLLSRTDSGQEDASATGDLDITGTLSISVTSSLTETTATISTTGFTDRVFQILGGNVTISGVTIKGGNVKGNGGSIYNNGALILTNVILIGNTASGKGGGIYNTQSATLIVTKSVLASNTAGDSGGGITNAGGTVTITNSTISGNTTQNGGGGFYGNSGTSNFNNVTIVNNTADSDGDGNGDGGGILNIGSALNAKNSIIAGNSDNSPATKQLDCSGILTSHGYNLIQNTAGCTITGTTIGNLIGVSPNLGPLQNNGGSTLTHALLNDSPAIDAGNSAAPGNGSNACEATDQRGVTRPRGLACDIGAFEVEDPPQRGPVFTVNIGADADDGVCSFANCSLREAIKAANAHPNGTTPDQIRFNVAGAGVHTLGVTSTLPGITDPVVMDATTQPGGSIELDGNAAGASVDGLTISAGNSTIRGLVIKRFSGNGILLITNGHNIIQGNTITSNGADGVRVLSGTGNLIRSNSIVTNTGLGIDLSGDGVTPNDTGDQDSGPNDLQNFPVVTRAIPGTGSTTIEGRLNSAANTAFMLEFFANTACDSSRFGGGETLLGSTVVTTDNGGDAQFTATVPSVVPIGRFITATATDPSGNTSEFSQCVPVGPGNDSWPSALRLTLTDTPSPAIKDAAVDQYLDKQGQSRWYKFTVQPGSRVILQLTSLPANYDLTLYKDIATAFKVLHSPQDLVRLGAEFAPDAFSPDAFSPDAFSPDAFSPDAFSPDAFSPDAFSPDAFSPDAFSPDAFSPDAFSPDAFSPDAFSPDAFSPDAFSPDAFSPDAFSPDAFSPDAFSGAQTRSLIAVSAFEGTASEGIIANTWDNATDFYVRVRGRNGAFSLQAPFHFDVKLLNGSCAAVNPALPALSTTAATGNYGTVILTDLARMPGTDAEKTTLQTQLADFAARPEVAGVVINVGTDAKVAAANTQADTYPACPFAKNLVAQSIKDIVDRYRALNPLEYVVIVGNDNVIPYFRYPDQALLASEKNFVPPVRDNTASQASLKLGYVLSQDRYGAQVDISLKSNTFPIPDLAVGRLVETALDATGMLTAYLSTNGGVVPTPTSALVTGYDFLEDDARAVQAELEAGIGRAADTLIATRTLSPQDPSAWTADDLRAQLLGSRHDLIFLAGHFSASSALAADYRTRLLSTDVISSPINMTNAIVFSAGCHAGYNIVDAHDVPLVTLEPDWVQTFARKQATLIAGTGYQYGDTDFIKYSERLYLEFSRQLRTGAGPVSVGKALVTAKHAYLAGTPELRGIDEKALLEATLFGLPMLSVNMPTGRLTPPPDPSIVTAANAFTTDPGATLGLRAADITVIPSLTQNMVLLDTISSTSTVTATYFSGSNGIVANPAEPVLPLEARNVSVPSTVLRGVGFRGGSYTDLPNVLPLIGAATTEIRGIHAPFLSNILYPVQPWGINYFNALANGSGGVTHLTMLPAQFKSSAPDSLTGTLRIFGDMSFRLYFSNNIDSFANNSVPALAAPPAITSVSATAASGNVTFRVNVVGNPAAGIQEVWVTYSATNGPFANKWQSFDLIQNAADSTLWESMLALDGTLSEDVRYMVQAVNGVGLVSLATNLGAYYVPGMDATPSQPTALSVQVPASSGAYGTQASVSAVLTNNGAPLAGQVVAFALGPGRRQTTTDNTGRATVTLPLLGLPGPYDVRASFAGTSEFMASSATATFTIDKQATLLSLNPSSPAVHRGDDTLVVATLTDATGRPLSEKTVFLVVTSTVASFSAPIITDYAGRALLGPVPLPIGTYTIRAYFSGIIPLPGQSLTLDDDRYLPSTAASALTLLSRPPDCSTAAPNVTTIWPPNGAFVPVSVLGVTDPDGDPVTISITGIRQDERVGSSPDGLILGPNSAQIRAERDGNGDGRVYHIFFTTADGRGGVCSGQVRLGIVPHDQGGNLDAIDGGPLYDSTQPG